MIPLLDDYWLRELSLNLGALYANTAAGEEFGETFFLHPSLSLMFLTWLKFYVLLMNNSDVVSRRQLIELLCTESSCFILYRSFGPSVRLYVLCAITSNPRTCIIFWHIILSLKWNNWSKRLVNVFRKFLVNEEEGLKYWFGFVLPIALFLSLSLI